MHDLTELPFKLTNGQKKALRSMAHHIQPVVYAGKEGLSPSMVQSLKAALKAHELIKVKIGQNCPLDREMAAQELVKITGAALVQIIGRMIVLYQANPDLPATKQISLPQ